MSNPTPKQKQILEYFKKYFNKKKYFPTQEETAKHFGLAKSTINEHVKELKERGYLKKADYKARAIDILEPNELVRVPLLGIISAGQQIEMFEQQNESIAVPKIKIKSNHNYFALKVNGESMIEKNIDNGDIVLIKEQSVAINGDDVVALIDNSETTLKTFYKDKNCIRLQPANKNMLPIIIEKDRDFAIQGIVSDLIKNPSRQDQHDVNDQKEFPQLPLNKIICGDVIEVMKKIPDNSIDMTFADPPFNLNKKYGNYKDKKADAEYIKWCEDWLTEMVRITKPTGSIFVHNIPKWLIYYANHLNKIAFFKHWIAWDSMSIPLGKTLLPAHYGILFYAKSPKEFTFHELRSPHKKCRKCGEMIKDYGGKKNQINPHGTLLSDVWADIHRIRHSARRDEHPCQLPEPLLERLILMSTNEGDVVLDPFIGAGTTALAAKRLGRNYIGIDIDPKYKEIVAKKIKMVSYRSSNGYKYNGDTSKTASNYLKNLTISEHEGIYPIDNLTLNGAGERIKSS
jgi:site-specific DNA-methyltransferase (adenine-specific)